MKKGAVRLPKILVLIRCTLIRPKHDYSQAALNAGGGAECSELAARYFNSQIAAERRTRVRRLPPPRAPE